jgi:hypothetical protein
MVRHWATKIGTESRVGDRWSHLFVCLFLFWLCFRLTESVNMRVYSLRGEL